MQQWIRGSRQFNEWERRKYCGNILQDVKKEEEEKVVVEAFCIFKKYFGNILEIVWKYFGNSWDIFWKYFGNVLEIFCKMWGRRKRGRWWKHFASSRTRRGAGGPPHWHIMPRPKEAATPITLQADRCEQWIIKLFIILLYYIMTYYAPPQGGSHPPTTL